MFVGFICLIIFLFTVYQLSKDDFIFLRKGVSVENIFNLLFVGLPIALFSSRLLYALLHPSINFLNPLVFLVIPYFPGLSLLGGIGGSWIFIKVYTARKKMPGDRIFDIIGIAFLLSLAIGIFLQAAASFVGNRLFAIEEIGRGMFAVAFFIFALLQFFKGRWKEGTVSSLSVIFYCLLAFLSTGFMLLLHKGFSISQFFATGALFIVFLGMFVYKENPWKRRTKK